MRNLLLSVLIFLVSWSTGAQSLPDKEEGAVSRFISRMEKSRLDIQFSYVLQEKTPVSGKGTVLIQDQSFKMTQNGLDIYCDGLTRWIVDREGKEVAVESVLPDSEVDATLPMSLLASIHSFFYVGPVQEGSFQNKPAQYAILSAKEAGDIRLMKLFFRGEIPIGLIVTMSNDRIVEITFDHLVFVKKGPLSDFQFDLSGLDSSWMINDLR